MSAELERDKKSNRYLIPNVSRALKILEYLAREHEEASLAEIAAAFSIPKNSVFRIIKSLEYYGYVEEEGRKYHVTPRLLYLGYEGMRRKGILESSFDVMHLLRDEVNETVMIGTQLGTQIVIVEQLPPFQFIRFETEVGRRVPMYASAPGKAILAFLPPEEQKLLLSQITFTRYTDKTIPSKSAMLKELKLIRERGYAVDEGEEVAEAHCVGSPILDYRGVPLAALWVVGPDFRLTADKFDHVGPVVSEHALMVSRRFGYDPIR